MLRVGTVLAPVDAVEYVVGVDGSAKSAQALQWAADYADRTGADLQLSTVWQWPMSYGAPVFSPAFEPEGDAKAAVEKARANVALLHGEVKIAVHEGRSGPVLVDLAEHAAALVVGRQGHGAIAEAVLGSVSAYCVRHAHCPVIVVR